MNRFEENKLLQEELEYKRAELAELERKIKKLGNCYIIFSDGSIDEMPINIAYTAINVDCYIQGNVFDSKEEAKLEVERRKLLHRFKMFKDKCNGEWKADFEDFNRKYFIIFSADNGHSVVTYQNFYEPFNIFGYFKNESDAIKAIDLFGDEIKKLFVDCECD